MTQSESLDARCLMALAIALVRVDSDVAQRLANQALRVIIHDGYNDGADPDPWPIRGIVLLQEFYGRARTLAAAHREERQAAKRRAQLERESHDRWVASVPSASDMLAKLRSGEPVHLSGNRLEWDDEMGALAGENDYGLDYYWGAKLSLEAVYSWRKTLCNGDQIGPSPDYGLCLDDDEDARCDSRELDEFYDLVQEAGLAVLEWACSDMSK